MERLLRASRGEAFAAVNRSVARGLERDLARLAAFRANGVEHLSGFAAGVLSLVTARFASLGLVLEALLSVELLLTRREHEVRTAFLALQSLVLEHVVSFLAFDFGFCP